MKKKKSYISIYLQILLSIITIIFLIMSFVNNKYAVYLQISLALVLINMGYNNGQYYKRKNMTIIYYVIGIMLLVLQLFKIIGV